MRRTPHFVAALALLTAAACGRDIPGAGGADQDGLLIEPPSLELYEGLEFTIDVRALRDDGRYTSVLGGSGLALEVADRQVISLDAAGRGKALRAGTTTIQARYDGKLAFCNVQVFAGTPRSLRVEPA